MSKDKATHKEKPKLISITFDSGRGRHTAVDSDGIIWVEKFDYGTSKVSGWERSKHQMVVK